MSRKTFNPSDWLAPATPSPDVQGSGASGQAPPSAIAQEIEVVVRRVEAAAIDIAPVYVEWRDLGFALADALGEGGRECYHRLSRFHPGYTAAGTDRQYTACLHAHGHGITVRTLFHLAGRAVTDARSVPAPSPASHPASSDGISPDILKNLKNLN